jgi:hypothetical protein
MENFLKSNTNKFDVTLFCFLTMVLKFSLVCVIRECTAVQFLLLHTCCFLFKLPFILLR